MDKLLLIDDEADVRYSFERIFGQQEGLELHTAGSGEEALELIPQLAPDLVIMDVRMGGLTGIETLQRLREFDSRTPVILMTAYGSEEMAVDAMRQGADDYIAKGRLQIDELEMRIARAVRSQKLETENRELRTQVDTKFGLENVIGQSPAMAEIFEVVQQVAPARASVLVLGESGTGKELIAKAIHNLSPRAKQPLVTVHCAALSPTLLESELFGHEKGAFTGAHERRIGRFEQANGGTLFLDEIGEIDQAIQVKLLRFLGERTFERVGSNQTMTSDVRIIAATNRNLEHEVAEGNFREDLFFRLRVVELSLPPLRDRGTDVVLLAKSFLQEFAQENAKAIADFHPDAVEALLNHAWPGNVRELRTAIEHAVVLCRTDTVTLRDLPPSVRGESATTPHPDAKEVLSKKNLTVEDAEKALIIRALKDCNGNRTQAAEKIGMSRRTLHRKLHTYNLHDL